MMKRFFIIDHCAVNAIGHNLTYASRVFAAAKDCNYVTYFITNKNSNYSNVDGADNVIKLIDCDYWDLNSPRNMLFNLIRHLFKKMSYDNKFYEGIDSLISSLELDQSDLVFLPSAGSAELRNLSKYTLDHPGLRITWHLLFRREIYHPSMIINKLTISSLLNYISIKLAFYKLRKESLAQYFHFYSDTIELSAIYRKVAQAPFETMAVPVAKITHNRRCAQVSNPFVITYMGDDRKEKGFKYLGYIIKKFVQNYNGNYKVVFRIQSNSILPGIKTDLFLHKDNLNNRFEIEILKGPFDESCYIKNIADSNVVILPYSERKYGWRSSGIFSECMATSTPTIYPDNTWMSKISEKRYGLPFRNIKQIPNLLIKIIENYPEFVAELNNKQTEWIRLSLPNNILSKLTDRMF